MNAPAGAVVHKYRLDFDRDQVARFNAEGPVLYVGLDPNANLCAWALARMGRDMTVETIAACGTGMPLPLSGTWAYLSTVVERSFVWHFFRLEHP